MSDQTQKKITRLNADTLSQVFDRVTVQALLNMVRITGGETDGITVPELSNQSGETSALLEAVKQQVIVLQVIADYLQAAPAPIPQTVENRIEQLQTEVRQVADQVAMLTRQFELDMRPIAEQFYPFTNQIITEVRQLADQQTVNNNMIQEIRQGTML